MQLFFDRVNRQAILEAAADREEFAVDGTLIESYASLKSIRPIDTPDQKVSHGSDDDDPGNPAVNFRGTKRRNATHRSIVDPEARLARKGDGQPALLSHSLHVLVDPRSGLCMDIAVAEANGHAERQQALAWSNARVGGIRCGPQGSRLTEVTQRAVFWRHSSGGASRPMCQCRRGRSAVWTRRIQRKQNPPGPARRQEKG